jgi:hypothetical protein
LMSFRRRCRRTRRRTPCRTRVAFGSVQAHRDHVRQRLHGDWGAV